MSKKFPKISVIIPARPDDDCRLAIQTLKKISYPKDLIEAFIAYGFFPSKQRNEAAKKAKGEIIYFIDNDSQIDKNAFKITKNIFEGKFNSFKNKKSRGFSIVPKFISEYIIKKLFSRLIYKGKIGAVGGPAVWWDEEDFFSQLSRGVTESFFAHYLMAARYRPIGSIHRSTEKELILCNLAVKSEVFKNSKGFNELLYPNEENELLNRIEKNGFQLIYHPGLLVYRRHRDHPLKIIKAFYNYGRGRMEQIRLEGFFMNFIFFFPLFFIIYLAALIIFHPIWFFIPLILYFFAGFASAYGFALRNKNLILVLVLPFLFLIAHLSYCIGNISGAITNFEEKEKSTAKVKIVKLKSFDSDWKED